MNIFLDKMILEAIDISELRHPCFCTMQLGQINISHHSSAMCDGITGLLTKKIAREIWAS